MAAIERKRGECQYWNIIGTWILKASRNSRVVVSGAAEAPLEAATLEIADSTEEAAAESVAEEAGTSTDVEAAESVTAGELVTDSVAADDAAVDSAAVDEAAAVSVEEAGREVLVSCRFTRWRGEAKAAEAPSARMAEDLKSMAVYVCVKEVSR